MPLVIRCDHCRSALRLPEEHIGKEVRCPSCQQTFTAKAVEEAMAPQPRPAPLNDESRDRPAPNRPPRRADDDEDYLRPSRRRRYYDDDYGGGPWKEPRRGKSILTLGIVGMCLFCIPLAAVSLGITSIVMATIDLGKMRNGLMDESGRGSTIGGMVCGMCGILFTIGILVLACLGGALDPNHR